MQKPTDPRNISSRDDGFMVMMGVHTSPMEHQIRGAPFTVKGLNFTQRDAKMSVLSNYTRFLEVDFERFDMTISPYILNQLEAILLLFPFQNPSPTFVHAVFNLCNIRGKSRQGTSYSVHGTRCSGDTTTSIANTVTNYFVVWVCMEIAKSKGLVTKWQSFHEGDDGVIGYDGADDLTDCFEFAEHFGFRIKLSHHTMLEDVTFCGRRMTVAGGKFTSYCDIIRTMSKLHVTCNNGDATYLLLAKAIAYYANDGHTPIVGAWAYWLIRLLWPQFYSLSESRLRRVLNSLHPYYRLKVANFRPDDISLCINEQLRSVIAVQYGISSNVQHQFERTFKHWYEIGFMYDPHKLYVPEMEVTEFHILGFPVNSVTTYC